MRVFVQYHTGPKTSPSQLVLFHLLLSPAHPTLLPSPPPSLLPLFSFFLFPFPSPSFPVPSHPHFPSFPSPHPSLNPFLPSLSAKFSYGVWRSAVSSHSGVCSGAQAEIEFSCIIAVKSGIR